MPKIMIGDGEYETPFTCDADYDNPSDWIRDSNENPVDYEDAVTALNELSQLRAENAALVKNIWDACERGLHGSSSGAFTELHAIQDIVQRNKPDTKGGE